MTKHANTELVGRFLRAGAYLVGVLCAGLPVAHAQSAAVPEAQQAVIEIVRLAHRDPDIVRAAIAPQLDPRGTINQIDRNLIISTSRANLRELKGLIEAVDIPPRQLLIRIDFNYGAASQLAAGPDAVPDYVTQSLIVSEGEFAYFNRSQATPSTSQEFTPYAAQLREDARRAEQSVALKADVRGERVMLALARTQARASAANDAAQEPVLPRSFSVDLNRWVSLAEDTVADTLDNQDSRLANSIPSTQGTTAVRVEIMPEPIR